MCDGIKWVRRDVRDNIAKPLIQKAKNKASNLFKNIGKNMKSAKDQAAKTGKAVTGIFRATSNNGVNNFTDAVKTVGKQVKGFLMSKPSKSKATEREREKQQKLPRRLQSKPMPLV